MSPLVMDKSPAAHREAFHFTEGNAALYQSRWPPQWEKIMTPSFVLPSFALNFYNLTFDKLGLEVYLKHTKKEHPEKEPPFHKPNVLPEMIPNVAVSMNVPSYLCMCVCVSAWQGGWVDSLRLHSSVCIRSGPNEAESLAFVRCICRDTEWWASHSAALPRGGSHTSEDPARGLHINSAPPFNPPMHKVLPHMLPMQSGKHAWLLLQIPVISNPGDIKYFTLDCFDCYFLVRFL